MPGISFICEPKGNLRLKESAISQSLALLAHTEDYEAKVSVNNGFCFLGYSAYKEYPIASFENEEFHIYLEGRIYGKQRSNIDAELAVLASLIFDDQGDVKERIAEWLLNTDGDFVVYIFHKDSGQVFILNDVFGRLPVYYHTNTDGRLIVSRELMFITSLAGVRAFDRMAMAQYLLFGYCLGQRTLLKDIFCLGPASLIRVNPRNSEIKIDTIHRFNFENKKYCDRNIKQHASELVSLFCEACKNRMEQPGKNVLSLSGGLDSRAVAAALCKTGTLFSAATFLKSDKSEALDAKIAEKLADELNFDWKLFELEPSSGRDFLRLLKVKSWLNPLNMSFILTFFDKLKQTYGSDMIYITGDGGDKLIPDIRPTKKLKDINALLNQAILQNAIFSLDDVVSITQIPANKIIQELKDHLLSYPEEDLNLKYVHFLIHERAIRWLFEGEDRNRSYFWSTSPFYSVRFFDYAMNIPDELKKGYKLYKEFLMELSPCASAIDNVHLSAPIRPSKTGLRLFVGHIYLNLPPNLRSMVRKMLSRPKSGGHNPNLVDCLQKQIRNCEPIHEYLSLDCVIRDCEKYSKKAIFNLFTVVSAIEQFRCSTSTIERFFRSNFV